jgi:hypothetical protein
MRYSLNHGIAKCFAQIRAGKELKLQGDGFVNDGDFVKDYWVFNRKRRGSVNVYCDDGRELYDADEWLSAERVSQ